jgi:hypothetical protein
VKVYPLNIRRTPRTFIEAPPTKCSARFGHIGRAARAVLRHLYKGLQYSPVGGVYVGDGTQRRPQVYAIDMFQSIVSIDDEELTGEDKWNMSEGSCEWSAGDDFCFYLLTRPST